MSEPIGDEIQGLPLSKQKFPVPASENLNTTYDKNKLRPPFKSQIEENLLGEKRESLEKKKKMVLARDIAVAERFSDLLAENVPQSGFEPPSSGRINILDIGCGFAPETSVVTSYFSGNNFDAKGVEGVSFFGIDISPEAIEIARQKYASTPKSEYTFTLGDAARLEDFPEIPEKVHVVIFRHPYVKVDEKTGRTWSRMLEQARERLADGGIAIFTTFMQEEQEMLAGKLNQFGYEIIIKKKNERAIPISEVSKSAYDGYILIARARKEQS